MFLYRVKRVSYGALLGLAIPLAALTSSAATAGEDDLEREINRAMAAIESYSAAQKDRAVAEGEALLQSIDRRLAMLQADADAAAEDVRQAWLERRARLQDLRRQAAEQLDGLRQAGAQAWVEAKQQFHSAVDELGEAFEDAAAQLGAS